MEVGYRFGDGSVFFLSACTNSSFLKIIAFIYKLLDVLLYFLPTLVIVMVSIDIFKNVMVMKDSDFKRNLMMAIKRIICAMAVYLIPSIVKAVIYMVDDSGIAVTNDFLACLTNIDDIEYYEKLDEKKKEQEEKAAEEWYASIDASKRFKDSVLKIVGSSKGDGSGTTSTGTVVGTTYTDLTEAQLKGLTALCIQEQGANVDGVAAEASLMANLFEERGSSYGSGGSGLYNYVQNSTWWNSAASYMSQTGRVTSELLDAVKDVLVNGNRTLDLWVNEHDCIDCGAYGFDVVSITNGNEVISSVEGRLNRSNYQEDVTKVHTKYQSAGEYWIFSTFPTASSDPFGYTVSSCNRFEECKKKLKG